MRDFPPIHETSVSGVRTLWVETSPPFTASLLFRVGVWDETPPIRGTTHLVEHLALRSLRNATYQYNGHVTGNHTAFWASGSPRHVVTHLRTLCANLAVLPTEQLGLEAGVLRAEAARRPQAHAATILTALFGGTGPGVSSQYEWALADPKGPAVLDWARHHFTAQNAVLLLDGPPPSDLSLEGLPAGEHRPYQLPENSNGNMPPRAESVGTQEAGMSIGSLAPRTMAARMAVALAAGRLSERLRHQAGLAYSVAPAYQPLDSDTAFLFLGADCDPKNATQMGRSFLKAIGDLAAHGPDGEELARLKRALPDDESVGRDALARAGLMSLGTDLLMGYAHLTMAEAHDLQEKVTGPDLEEVLDVLANQSYAVTPRGEPPLLPAQHKPAEPVVDGDVFDPAEEAAESGLVSLIIGPAGLSLVLEDLSFSILWDAVVLAVDTGDVWEIHRREGGWVRIAPVDWSEPDHVSELLEEFLPDTVRIATTPIVYTEETQSSSGQGDQDGLLAELDAASRRKWAAPSLGVTGHWIPSPTLVPQTRRRRPRPMPGDPLPVVPIIFAGLLMIIGVVLMTLAFSTQHGRSSDYVTSVLGLGAVAIGGGVYVWWRAYTR